MTVRMLRFSLRAAPLAGLLLGPACYDGVGGHDDATMPPGSEPGSAESEGGTDGQTEPPFESDRAPVVMRRLTRAEFNNTVRDLVGDESAPADIFPPDELVHGFDNNAAALTFPPVLAEQALAVAPGLAELALENPDRFAACVSTSPDRDCAQTFLDHFGQRAWRRPLEPAELDRLLGVFDVGEADEGFERGLHMAVQAALISAPFFYRMEFGTEEVVEGKPEYVHPTGWEMASRLSYFLWSSMPDQELFDAAMTGGLDTPEQIAAQAERMLEDPRAHDTVSRFHDQWLESSGIPYIAKDPEFFPTWDGEIGPALGAQLGALVDYIAFNEEWTDLYTADYTFLDPILADFYGVDGPAGDELERMTLSDPARHAGILSHAGLLALNSGFDQSSPTLRGRFVRERLLCGELPPPPEEVDATPKSPNDATTTRERYEPQVEDQACAVCHRLMDPIGFGLESFDGAGQFRTEEGGVPINDRGEVFDSDIGAFQGATELAQGMAKSEQARRCFSTQWYRYAYGRELSDDAQATLDQLDAALVDDPRYLRLLVALTQTDDFLYSPRR